MKPMLPTLQAIGLLTLSNVFMTFAWYAHLKTLNDKPWFVAAVLSWGIAFFEYLLQVPGNRIGFTVMSLPQLKIMQEVITLYGVRAVSHDIHEAAVQAGFRVGRRAACWAPCTSCFAANRERGAARARPRYTAWWSAAARAMRRDGGQNALRLGGDGRAAGVSRLLPAAGRSGGGSFERAEPGAAGRSFSPTWRSSAMRSWRAPARYASITRYSAMSSRRCTRMFFRARRAEPEATRTAQPWAFDWNSRRLTRIRLHGELRRPNRGVYREEFLGPGRIALHP